MGGNTETEPYPNLVVGEFRAGFCHCRENALAGTYYYIVYSIAETMTATGLPFPWIIPLRDTID